jgi:hypothetical protein
MPSGGYRPGAGRPRGSRDRTPRAPRPAKKCEPEVLQTCATSADRNGSLQPVSRAEAEAAAIAYLTSVIRDGTASVDRKDRAALGLLSLTRLKPVPPKPKRVRDPIDEALREFKLLR